MAAVASWRQLELTLCSALTILPLAFVFAQGAAARAIGLPATRPEVALFPSRPPATSSVLRQA